MVDLDELERLEREATPGPWKIAITKFASGDGWYVVDAHGDFIAGANAPKPSTDEPNTRCIATTRNALPDLIAELRMLRAAHEEREEVQAAWGQGLREAYETGRRDALREAIDLCRRTEAGDTNHDWREAAKCCRELIESLAAKAAEEAAIRARRRVREVLEANGTNPERFVSEWCRAQTEYEESAR